MSEVIFWHVIQICGYSSKLAGNNPWERTRNDEPGLLLCGPWALSIQHTNLLPWIDPVHWIRQTLSAWQQGDKNRWRQEKATSPSCPFLSYQNHPQAARGAIFLQKLLLLPCYIQTAASTPLPGGGSYDALSTLPGLSSACASVHTCVLSVQATAPTVPCYTSLKHSRNFHSPLWRPSPEPFPLKSWLPWATGHLHCSLTPWHSNSEASVHRGILWHLICCFEAATDTS